MAGWVEQKIRGVLEFIVADLTGTLSDQLWELFANLFSSPVAVLDDPTVIALTSVATAASLGALPAIIAWAALRRTLEAMDGSSITPPEELVRRSAGAGVAVTAIFLVAWYAATLADRFRDVLESYGVGVSFLKLYFTTTTGGLTILLLMLVFLIGTGLLLIQRAVLGLEFAGLLIVGSFLALTKVNSDNPAPWQLWKREILAVCLTPVLQLLILLLFTRRFTGVDPASFGRWLDSFALLYLLWHTPRWARLFTYSTGAGNTVAGMSAEAGRFGAMRHLIRSAAKGG